jgi:formate dehydrogenase subunit delta
MTMSKLDRLVSMINQISLNLASNGSEDQVSVLVAEHLNKFWSPPMKRLILSQDLNSLGLSPISVKAISHLRSNDH